MKKELWGRDEGGMWIWKGFREYVEEERGREMVDSGMWVMGMFRVVRGMVGVRKMMVIRVGEGREEFGMGKGLGGKGGWMVWVIMWESVRMRSLLG